LGRGNPSLWIPLISTGLPIQATKQDIILNELGLNINIIDELKTIL
jgi:hypothetical protein